MDRNMRVLLVEDEPQAAQVLAKGLREQAYAVDIAADGDTALFQAGTTDYDALILDLMLPRVNGLAVCRSIRDAGNPVPILMLTARDAVESRIEGLLPDRDATIVPQDVSMVAVLGSRSVAMQGPSGQNVSKALARVQSPSWACTSRAVTSLRAA